jgi:hypothetical protein
MIGCISRLFLWLAPAMDPEANISRPFKCLDIKSSVLHFEIERNFHSQIDSFNAQKKDLKGIILEI